MREDFFNRAKDYFPDRYDEFIGLLDKPSKHGFFLNTIKCPKDLILENVDFPYYDSNLNPNAYFCDCDSIGKTKAYELGLIYPQDVESSYPSTFVDTNSAKLILDLCSAPGGKSINILNKCSKDSLLIANDISYKRAMILSSNFERLGLSNTIVTCKKPEDFIDKLKGQVDIVILDAPCSGEGMIRKYPEIIDNYDVENIKELAKIQSDLLNVAYECLKEGGQLIYSTCTYAFEEDEDQIRSFISNHDDMELIKLQEAHASILPGTIKLSFLDGTEGQYMALMIKRGNYSKTNLKLLKTTKNAVVERFIKDNLNVDAYYIYNDKDKYYLSFEPLIDLGKDVLRYGIYLGEIVKDRFEPSHAMYRSCLLDGLFKYEFELSASDYDRFIQGLELFNDTIDNHYYRVTYKGMSLGFGKGVNGTFKNKYPKGLRRML